METSKVRVAALVAAVVAVFALMMAGTAAANTGGSSGSGSGGSGAGGGCSRGAAVGNGAVLTNSFSFNLCAHGTDPHDVTGFFRATGTPPSNLLVAPQGPVTCAVFQGDEVSFLYPLTEGSRPPFPSGTTAILIYAKTGGPGVGKVGFTPPLPTQTFLNRCDFSTPQAIATKASAQTLTSGSVAVTAPKS